jgi:glutathione S-transferase
LPLQLYAHPLSSFCWKALIALYEAEALFEFRMLGPDHPENFAELSAKWPMAKMPLLSDPERGVDLPETSIIIEHIDRHHGAGLIPADPDAALQARLWDRFYDLHVHAHMQKVIFNRLREPADKDPFGVAQARAELRKAYIVAEAALADGRAWAAGDTFTLADCSASPALHYADKVEPFATTHPRLHAFLLQLRARPSFARVLEEAEPYAHMFPDRD